MLMKLHLAFYKQPAYKQLFSYTNNIRKFSGLKSIIGKILKSLIINMSHDPENYFISRRHRLLGETTKQSLSTFESKKA